MYHLSTFLKCDVYGVGAEKRREEKRREEGTLSIQSAATVATVPVLTQLYIIIRYRLSFGKAAL
jgi:hypothetical protein